VVADTVFLHIGLPKTATTYLQTILWHNRELLEQQGLRLPGRNRRDHLWSSRVVREGATLARSATPHQLGAWDRVRADVEKWPGRCLVSHEFFASATADQAAQVIDELAPAEVHLVVTAREPLGLFAASWQESIKNRDTTPMAEYSRAVTDDPGEVWNWRALDVRLVLERWTATLPADRVHVLPLPGADAPRRLIWDRFAGLVGIDPDSVDLGESFPNESMGVVEAETLRRINHHLDGFRSAIDRGTYIRTFLADERLVPRRGERFWPAPDQVEECRVRGRDAVAYIAERGFDVIGDLDALLVPQELPERRIPSSVTDAEVAEVAVALAARMLYDVRDLRHERRALRQELETLRSQPDIGVRVALSRRFPRLRRLLRT
jgi:hypothetical protein